MTCALIFKEYFFLHESANEIESFAVFNLCKFVTEQRIANIEMGAEEISSYIIQWAKTKLRQMNKLTFPTCDKNTRYTFLEHKRLLIERERQTSAYPAYSHFWYEFWEFFYNNLLVSCSGNEILRSKSAGDNFRRYPPSWIMVDVYKRHRNVGSPTTSFYLDSHRWKYGHIAFGKDSTKVFVRF